MPSWQRRTLLTTTYLGLLFVALSPLGWLCHSDEAVASKASPSQIAPEPWRGLQLVSSRDVRSLKYHVKLAPRNTSLPNLVGTLRFAYLFARVLEVREGNKSSISTHTLVTMADQRGAYHGGGQATNHIFRELVDGIKWSCQLGDFPPTSGTVITRPWPGRDAVVVVRCAVPPHRRISQASLENMSLRLMAYEVAETEAGRSSTLVYQEDIPMVEDVVPARKARAIICAGPLFLGHSWEDGTKIFGKLLSWWAFHRHVGMEQVYVYDRSGLCRAVSEASLTEHLENLGLFCVDFSQDQSVIEMLEPKAKSRPFFDQQAIYEHCWLQHRLDADWVFNIDVDEFLVTPAQYAGTSQGDTARAPVPKWLDAFLSSVESTGRVATISLPRAPMYPCEEVDQPSVDIGGAAVEEGLGVFLKNLHQCNRRHGFVYQKAAHQPALIFATGTHLSYALSEDDVIGHQGLFVYYDHKPDIAVADYPMPYLAHMGNKYPEEQQWPRSFMVNEIFAAQLTAVAQSADFTEMQKRFSEFAGTK